MKKALVLSILVMLVAVPLVGAQTGVWDSSFSVLNLGSTDASVSVVFYDDSGVATTPACLRYVGDPPTCDLNNPFTLAPGAKEEVFLAAMGTDLPDGRYSVVISADQPVAAIGSLVGNDSNNFYTGSYTGLEDAGQTTMYLPGVQWGFYNWNSHISVQNLTGSAQDVSIMFYTEGTNVVCDTQGPSSVPAYSSWHLDTETLDLSACDAGSDGFNGAVSVTGAGPIAVIDNQTTGGGLYFETAYSGFIQGASTLYAPSVFRGAYPPGVWNTSFNILNVGSADAEVTLTISGSGGDYTLTNTLSALQGWFVYPPVDIPGLPVYEWEALSAVITSDGEPIVAIANSANSLQQALTYNAVDAGGSTVAVPVVQRNYYGWDTAVAVQNLGPDDVVVHVAYSANSNPYGTPWAGGSYDTPAIASGAALQLYQGDGDMYLPSDNRIPESYTGGAILTLTSGTGPIAAVVNTTNGPGQVDQIPGPGDWSTSFNAINQ